MDDVASARSENANLRKIQQKLLQWDVKDQPLAPLTPFQLDTIEKLGAVGSIGSQVSKNRHFRNNTTENIR